MVAVVQGESSKWTAYLRHASLHPTLHAEGSKVGLSFLLPLGQGHVQWLGDDDAPVHLCHGLGGFLRRGEAHKAEALGVGSFVHHDLGAGDVAKLCKLLPQAFIVHLVLEVLHVQVDSLVPTECAIVTSSNTPQAIPRFRTYLVYRSIFSASYLRCSSIIRSFFF